MAVSEKAIEFLGNSLDKGRATPGQSLTNSPDNKYKWESPPEFTSTREATTYVFGLVTVPATTTNLLMSVTNGVGIVDLASIILYSGFLEGKWNPDLMTLLMEPTMYMIMALAEKAEIDYVIETGDDEKPKEMSADKEVEILKKAVEGKLEFVQNGQGEVEEFDQSDYKEKYLNYIDTQYDRFKQETLTELKNKEK